MIDLRAFSDTQCRWGFFTDVHFNSAKSPSEGNYYSDAPAKLAIAVAEWNKHDLDFIMMNGDYIDHGGQSSSQALADLAAIEAVASTANAPVKKALGNHEHDAVTKAQFISATGMSAGYYSFDEGGIHFIVLDPNYRSDSDSDHYSAGNYNWTTCYIPPGQRAWLEADLAATDKPVIVFCHQRLAGNTQHDVTNAYVIRPILEASGKVGAVFTGHRHINDHVIVNGINYHNMMAMTAGAYPLNAYAVIEALKDGTVRGKGFGQQVSWSA